MYEKLPLQMENGKIYFLTKNQGIESINFSEILNELYKYIKVFKYVFYIIIIYSIIFYILNNFLDKKFKLALLIIFCIINLIIIIAMFIYIIETNNKLDNKIKLIIFEKMFDLIKNCDRENFYLEENKNIYFIKSFLVRYIFCKNMNFFYYALAFFIIEILLLIFFSEDYFSNKKKELIYPIATIAFFIFCFLFFITFFLIIYRDHNKNINYDKEVNFFNESEINNRVILFFVPFFLFINIFFYMTLYVIIDSDQRKNIFFYSIIIIFIVLFLLNIFLLANPLTRHVNIKHTTIYLTMIFIDYYNKIPKSIFDEDIYTIDINIKKYSFNEKDLINNFQYNIKINNKQLLIFKNNNIAKLFGLNQSRINNYTYDHIEYHAIPNTYKKINQVYSILESLYTLFPKEKTNHIKINDKNIDEIDISILYFEIFDLDFITSIFNIFKQRQPNITEDDMKKIFDIIDLNHDKIYALYGTLSGGQMIRVKIALNLIKYIKNNKFIPKIIIFGDELKGLNIHLRKKIVNNIINLFSETKLILFNSPYEEQDYEWIRKLNNIEVKEI